LSLAAGFVASFSTRSVVLAVVVALAQDLSHAVVVVIVVKVAEDACNFVLRDRSRGRHKYGIRR
jgi:hypothetical protein